MTEEQIVLLIDCGEPLLEPIKSMLASHDLDVQSSQRRDMDGAVATSFLVLASIAIRTAPVLLDAITRFLQRHQVRRIEFGDYAIDNPRPEDIEELVRRLPQPGGDETAK
jgi:hypothetical protein